MIIVTGCPRSGTSCMMDQLRIALGEDRILGKKFPQIDNLLKQKEKRDNENEIEYESRMYLLDKTQFQERMEEANKSKDMNPNGFWENRYTVRGVQWHFGINVQHNDVCKIVSQGLAKSDPKYIDKIIYMVRCPRQVAKSQERLRRIPWMKREEEQELKVHTPEMFINVAYRASLWINKYANIPILYVDFDKMISDPEETLNQVRLFLNEGDFSNHTIVKKLKRSSREDVHHDLWNYADEIYNLLLNKDHKGIIKYCEDNIQNISKDNVTFHCVRRGMTTNYKHCEGCIKNPVIRNNFKKFSESQNIDWKNEPCMYECLTGPNISHISMKESIKNNFWIDK